MDQEFTARGEAPLFRPIRIPTGGACLIMRPLVTSAVQQLGIASSLTITCHLKMQNSRLHWAVPCAASSTMFHTKSPSVPIMPMWFQMSSILRGVPASDHDPDHQPASLFKELTTSWKLLELQTEIISVVPEIERGNGQCSYNLGSPM